MKIVVHIKSNLTWRYGRTKNGNYIGVCEPFAQTVQAETFSQLGEMINEATKSTLDELFSSGDLDAFLRERGWQSSERIPKLQERRKVSFDMPFELRGTKRRDLEETLCEQA